MNFKTYEDSVVDTTLYTKSISDFVDSLEIPNADNRATLERLLRIVYNVLGMAGEAGEVAEKIKKIIRDKQSNFVDEDISQIKLEIGDCLWYNGAVSKELNSSLEEVAQLNINKLQSRKQRQQIKGSGDNR